MDNRLKKGLGRGLSSLLGDTQKKVETNKVPIKDISRNKFQPRKHFSKENLDELTNSIKERGVIQPIVVRPDKVNKDKYEKNLAWWGSWLMYPIEYTCTKVETNITTKSMIELNISNLRAQLISIKDDFIQVAKWTTYTSPWTAANNNITDKTKDIRQRTVGTIIAPFFPK